MKHRGRMMAVSLAVIATLALGATGAFAAKSATASSGTTTSTPAAPSGGRGPGGPGAHHGGRGGMMGVGLVEVVAKLTGESTSTILTARQSGTSFAATAKAKGVTVAEIVQLASHAPQAALDSQVADGLITSAQAKTIMSDLKTHWTEELNSTATGPGPGDSGHDGHAGPPPTSSDGRTSSGTSGFDGTSSIGGTSGQTTVTQ